MSKTFKNVKNQTNFIDLEHRILKFWEKHKIFDKLMNQNKGQEPWSFMDGPITANNPMGVIMYIYPSLLFELLKFFSLIKPTSTRDCMQ